MYLFTLYGFFAAVTLTLLYDLDLNIVKMYLRIKNEVYGSEAKQDRQTHTHTDRQTDMTEHSASVFEDGKIFLFNYYRLVITLYHKDLTRLYCKKTSFKTVHSPHLQAHHI